MCGIVGAIMKPENGFSIQAENCFYQMLEADTFRGDDSTGVIFVNNDTSFGIMKDVFPATYITDTIKSSEQGRRAYMKGKAMIGHNRKGTIGGVSEDTAHPFVVGDNFSMVHNGTLRNHKALADTVVDSEALAIHLSKVLVENFNKHDFEEAIGKVNGAFAIAAYNQDSHCVYLTRNSERPLAYVETPVGVFFASEVLMLQWICFRNNLLTKDTIPIEIPPNVLVTIDLDKNKVTKEEYVPKKAIPPSKITGGGGANMGSGLGGRVVTLGTKGLSKNQYKSIYRHWVGRRVEFFVDDFIETDFPNTIGQGSHIVNLMGESDTFTCSHTVVGKFDLHELEANDLSFVDCLFSGNVSDMSFNKATGSITIILNDLKKVPKSTLLLTNENKSTVH